MKMSIFKSLLHKEKIHHDFKSNVFQQRVRIQELSGARPRGPCLPHRLHASVTSNCVSQTPAVVKKKSSL